MRIKKVTYICDYKLEIQFNNGETKIVDLEEKIRNSKGIFSPLKKREYFSKVMLDDCSLSICWANGADICPDVLYEMGKDVVKNKKQMSQKKSIRTVKIPKTVFKKGSVKLPTVKRAVKAVSSAKKLTRKKTG